MSCSHHLLDRYLYVVLFFLFCDFCTNLYFIDFLFCFCNVHFHQDGPLACSHLTFSVSLQSLWCSLHVLFICKHTFYSLMDISRNFFKHFSWIEYQFTRLFGSYLSQTTYKVIYWQLLGLQRSLMGAAGFDKNMLKNLKIKLKMKLRPELKKDTSWV